MATLQALPGQLTAGDSWSWLWASADYSPAEGWAAAFRLVGPGIAFSIGTVAEDSGFRAGASATITGALVVGARGVPCTLIGWVSRAADRFQVYSAPCLLLPDPATVTGDLRGHATRTLEAINALLEGRATKDQQSYKLGDRELSRIPIPELLQLRDYYASEARREADAAALASGRPRATMIHTRMARA